MAANLILAFFLCAARAPASSALSAEAERLLHEGVTHLYDLDYEKSRASFRKIIEAEPENPFGYLFESGGIWWQSSQEYGLFKGTPTLQGVFERDVNLALKKAQTLMKSKDKEALSDANFAAGMALGTRGQWALMRGHWLKACFDGHKAVKFLNKCVKLDKNYYDAYLGLGVFDYQASRLPAALKLSAMLCGAHGDEKRGLDRIQLALEKGRYGSRQAAQFLTSIFIIDQRDYVRAQTIIQKLHADFPASPYFQFLNAALLYKLGDHAGSLKGGQELFERNLSDYKAFNRKFLSLICGLSGDKCLDKEDATMAYSWFTNAAASEAPAGPWLSFVHLNRGYLADILGKREEAASDYRWVLSKSDFSDFHSRAKECLAAPCRKENILSYLSALSRDEPWPPQKK